MADETPDDRLREMAEHRGLKLVKSRRRKPGTGDYGKYGLSDASGKALLGIGKDGLTATADDITSYLRTGAAGTWKASADETPDAPPAKPVAATESDDSGDGRIRSVPKRSRATRGLPTPKARTVDKKDAGTEPRHLPKAAKKPERKPDRKPEPEPDDEIAETEVEPTVKIRLSKPADAAALAKLLGQLGGIALDGDAVAANLAAARKLKGNMVVAELGELVGCCAWSLIPTIHRGMVGRLTVLVVDEGHRRRGIATALLDAAIVALAKSNCAFVEALSDIEIKNAHNFFRTRSFEQTSYRFLRKISD